MKSECKNMLVYVDDDYRQNTLKQNDSKDIVKQLMEQTNGRN